jgi:hypothetical protein
MFFQLEDDKNEFGETNEYQTDPGSTFIPHNTDLQASDLLDEEVQVGDEAEGSEIEWEADSSEESDGGVENSSSSSSGGTTTASQKDKVVILQTDKEECKKFESYDETTKVFEVPEPFSTKFRKSYANVCKYTSCFVVIVLLALAFILLSVVLAENDVFGWDIVEPFKNNSTSSGSNNNDNTTTPQKNPLFNSTSMSILLPQGNTCSYSYTCYGGGNCNPTINSLIGLVFFSFLFSLLNNNFA